MAMTKANATARYPMKMGKREGIRRENKVAKKEMWNRLEQFKILNIIEITNVTIYSIIVIGIAWKLVAKSSMFIVGEHIYKQIREMEKGVVDQGSFMKDERPKKGIVGHMGIVLFLTIIISNIIGLIPYSYTITSQFIITIGWSLMIIIGITYSGIKKKGLIMMSNFVPSGTPLYLVRLLSWIEIISYMSRGLSLGIRLGANMLAGHCLLKIVMSFGYELLSGIWLIIPIFIIGILLLLELGIAFLQAYVFTILVSYYNKDAD